MNELIPFEAVTIETCSACNRRCPTCIRNSYPDKALVQERLDTVFLPDEIVYSIIDQLDALDFKGPLWLSFYNEPLLDPRIVDFCKYARAKNKFTNIGFNSNGDLLNETVAKQLDGYVHQIIVSLYGRPETSIKYWKSLFKETKVAIEHRDHATTHFSPRPTLPQNIQRLIDLPCIKARHWFIINFQGAMMRCCEEIVSHFDLGNIQAQSVQELWYSTKNQKIIESLGEPGGRRTHPYCSICPR